MKLSKAMVPDAVAGRYEADPASTMAQRLLARIDRLCLVAAARWMTGARVHLRLWDGSTVATSDEAPVGSLTIKDRATLWRLVRQPELAFAEGYTDGRIEVAGNLVRILESVNGVLAGQRLETREAATRTATTTTIASARRNVHHHYDLGNDFYRLWLDEAMVYTCAYFETPGMSLEAAQQAKLEYVCRKLGLREGDRVIEAGCGWGALAIHMAKRHGVTVRAYNISTEQLAYARAEAGRQGVAGRVSFIDGDVRSIAGECDAFVSVGMLEHIGLAEYAALGQVIDRVIDRRQGRGLLHFIGRNHAADVDPWIRKYIFPGGYVPVLSEVTARVLEPWSLSVTDVENLRPHYAATLRHWRARFEQASARVAEMFDDRFVRMWRLYLAGAETCFTIGDQQLFQVTFSRPGEMPGQRTRADLYSRDGDAAKGCDHGHV